MLDMVCAVLLILVVYLGWMLLGYIADSKEAATAVEEPKVEFKEVEPEFDSIVGWFWYAILHK